MGMVAYLAKSAFSFWNSDAIDACASSRVIFCGTGGVVTAGAGTGAATGAGAGMAKAFCTNSERKERTMNEDMTQARSQRAANQRNRKEKDWHNGMACSGLVIEGVFTRKEINSMYRTNRIYYMSALLPRKCVYERSTYSDTSDPFGAYRYSKILSKWIA